jgi:hypothetical protein
MALSKKKILAVINETVGNLVIDAGTKEKVLEALEKAFASKGGGRTSNIEELVQRDAAGNIVKIKCSRSGLFLPATPEVFYESKDGKGIKVKWNGKEVALKRLSKVGESVYKKHIAEVKAEKTRLTSELLGLDVNAPDFKTKHAEIKKKLSELDKTDIDYTKYIDVNTGKLKKA